MAIRPLQVGPPTRRKLAPGQAPLTLTYHALGAQSTSVTHKDGRTASDRILNMLDWRRQQRQLMRSHVGVSGKRKLGTALSEIYL
jgi:hypothetical protein